MLPSYLPVMILYTRGGQLWPAGCMRPARVYYAACRQ